MTDKRSKQPNAPIALIIDASRNQLVPPWLALLLSAALPFVIWSKGAPEWLICTYLGAGIGMALPSFIGMPEGRGATAVYTATVFAFAMAAALSGLAIWGVH